LLVWRYLTLQYFRSRFLWYLNNISNRNSCRRFSTLNIFYFFSNINYTLAFDVWTDFVIYSVDQTWTSELHVVKNRNVWKNLGAVVRKLVVRWRMLSLMFRPLYPRECIPNQGHVMGRANRGSCPGRKFLKGGNHLKYVPASTYCIWGWVRSSAGPKVTAKRINLIVARSRTTVMQPSGTLHTDWSIPVIRLHIWSRRLSKWYLIIQSVPQREHHTSPLQRSTG
jgi:hypothetical protein